jgi:hypothetical protein
MVFGMTSGQRRPHLAQLLFINHSACNHRTSSLLRLCPAVKRERGRSRQQAGRRQQQERTSSSAAASNRPSSSSKPKREAKRTARSTRSGSATAREESVPAAASCRGAASGLQNARRHPFAVGAGGSSRGMQVACPSAPAGCCTPPPPISRPLHPPPRLPMHVQRCRAADAGPLPQDPPPPSSPRPRPTAPARHHQ